MPGVIGEGGRHPAAPSAVPAGRLAAVVARAAWLGCAGGCPASPVQPTRVLSSSTVSIASADRPVTAALSVSRARAATRGPARGRARPRRTMTLACGVP